MSVIVTDENREVVQAFRLPVTGLSTVVPLDVVGSHPTGALNAGMYRIISSTDVTVASGVVATASDMPMRANQPEYFYVNAASSVSVYVAVGVAGATCTLTRMP